MTTRVVLPRVLVPHPHVRVDDSILSGSPHVVGSKVPVRRLWAWHRSGTTVETLVRRYPNLGPGRILDALSFAYDNLDVVQADLDREQKLLEEQGKPDRHRPTSQLALPFAPSPTGSRHPGEAPLLPPPAPPLAPRAPSLARSVPDEDRAQTRPRARRK